MTSTVLDAAVCLLLVSAGVVAVTTASPDRPADGDRADRTLATLTEVTATVEHERRAGDVTRQRRRHDTLAGHLAAAALADAEVDERPFTPSTGYVDAVRRTVREAIGPRTQVVVDWRPYPGAPLWARVVVGGSPPATAERVHAATTRVPSGLDSVSVASSVTSETLGRRLAARVVAERFPVDELGYALDDRGTAPFARDRYRTGGAALGVSVPRRPTSDDVRRLNDRFVDSLGARLAADVDERGVASVRKRTSLSTVRVTVRTWR